MQTAFPCGKGNMPELPGAVFLESRKLCKSRLSLRDNSPPRLNDLVLAVSLSRGVFPMILRNDP